MSAVEQLVSSLHVDTTDRVVCPDCSPERKKYNLKELAIDATNDGWRYYCHHCGSNGFVSSKKTTYRRAENNVIPMRTLDTTKLQAQHYDFLKSRGISAQTAENMQLLPS